MLRQDFIINNLDAIEPDWNTNGHFCHVCSGTEHQSWLIITLWCFYASHTLILAMHWQWFWLTVNWSPGVEYIWQIVKKEWLLSPLKENNEYSIRILQVAKMHWSITPQLLVKASIQQCCTHYKNDHWQLNQCLFVLILLNLAICYRYKVCYTRAIKVVT